MSKMNTDCEEHGPSLVSDIFCVKCSCLRQSPGWHVFYIQNTVNLFP